jgi:hypothetical protein
MFCWSRGAVLFTAGATTDLRDVRKAVSIDMFFMTPDFNDHDSSP